MIDNLLPFLTFGLLAVAIQDTQVESTVGAVFGPVAIVCCVLYILFADGLGEGQSIGKRLLGIRVVDSRTGAPCTYRQSFVRNIFYIIGIFDWICIFGEQRQRLGDMVARTIVIDV